MPKTTKTSRKPSPASTKKSGFKRRFDITNKKVQFFVVIGIVAILGGGYFTLKSFAASDYVYTLANFGYHSNNTFTVSSGNKSSGQAVNIGSNVQSRSSAPKLVEPGMYMVCTVSRSITNNGSLKFTAVVNNTRYITNIDVRANPGQDFLRNCNTSKYVWVPERQSVRLSMSHNGGSVHLAYALLVPAPSGTSGK